jgi:hypothetical protein
VALGAALSLGNERSASLGAFSLSTFSKRLGDDMNALFDVVNVNCCDNRR